MIYTEQLLITNVLLAIQERHNAISKARRKAQRKVVVLQSLDPDTPDTALHELQEQNHQSSQLDYLVQSTLDYINGEITNGQLKQILAHEKEQKIILN